MQVDKVKQILDPLKAIELTTDEFKDIVKFLSSRVRIFQTNTERSDFMTFYEILNYYCSKPKLQ